MIPRNIPRIALLPRLYRRALTMTRRHGLFTLARLHHRFFRHGQVVRLPDGEWLYIPGDPHYFGFLTGLHENHVREVIRTYLQPGDTAVDVGANIGYFAAMMAAQVGPRGRVVAVEPVPQTFDVLCMNAGLASDAGLHLDPIPAAVSSSDGTVSLCRAEHSTLHQVTFDATANAECVKALTLVSLLEQSGIDGVISLLKVDVEGHELAVLEGAFELFKGCRIKRMIIEVTPGQEAFAIAKLLRDCKASWSVWLRDCWLPCDLQQLPHRTDVLVEFSATK